MNWRAIRAIIQKDIRVALKNRGVCGLTYYHPSTGDVRICWVVGLSPE